MRISDWSSDVCSSDLNAVDEVRLHLGQLLLAEPIPVGNVVYGYHATDSKQRKQERGHHEFHDAPGAVTVVGMQRKRSEEHTSELQSLMRISYAVFCLKKKKRT